MENTLKKKTITGFFWRFAERCGAQGVNFVVQLVLARLIVPKLFGVVALITVFTDILQVFVDSGLGNALIQKKEADDLDFSSVFYFNMFMCSILYIGMYLFAPVIDNVIYHAKYDNLTSYIRVLSLVLIISGIKNVQQAFVAKKMIFKKFFYATLGGTITAAVVGISMAFLGFGVWAIIAQNLVNKLIDTIVLWFIVKWRPKLMFSFERLKGLFSYGWKLLFSALIDVFYNNIRQLLIGNIYSSESLAFYNQGKKFPSLVVTNINTSIDSVLLPAMSKEQENKKQVKAMTRRSIMTSSFIMWPIMIGLCAIATPLVRLLLTDKWLPCVPFLQIFCLIYAFMPIHTANLSAIKAMGRSDIFLKLEIVKKFVGIGLLLSTMYISVYAMSLSFLASTIISSFINAYPNKKLLGYSYFEQICDILPNILIATFMGIAVYLLGLAMSDLPLIICLCIQIIFGALIYFFFSYIFKIDSFVYCFSFFKKILKFKK